MRFASRYAFLAALFLMAAFRLHAQKAIVEETVTDIRCDGPNHAVQHFREQTRILNEQGASLATFVCSLDSHDRLTDFRGIVTDASGKEIYKIRERNLKRTEYSPFLAIDEYKLYFDYTPPSYPVTVTYEWTIDTRDNLVEFPRFCPQSDYEVAVEKAVYRLTVPERMEIRHALRNIAPASIADSMSRYSKTYTLELAHLPAIHREPYARPLVERCPMAYFAPADFTYYGTKGSLRSWKDYGLWEYSLISGTGALPEEACHRVHQLTDTLSTIREKVQALYQELGRTTRYVAILLGIGGQRPAPAASVWRTGFGDCKGLTNYMQAMLREAGITSHYTTVSTSNRRLLPDFASVGQLNHVVLQVPLSGDTLWLECTNPQLPFGFVHSDIAGHDAIEVSQQGGRLVRIPAYADSLSLLRRTFMMEVLPTGAITVDFRQEGHGGRLLEASEEQAPAPKPRATVTGQRMFIPVSPLSRRYRGSESSAARQEDVWIATGYCDEDDITIVIPEGYDIEAMPRAVSLHQPFGSFVFDIRSSGREIHATYRLLIRSGHYAKTAYPELVAFQKTIVDIYNQKIVVKKSQPEE